jgi:hypothetical protein
MSSLSSCFSGYGRVAARADFDRRRRTPPALARSGRTPVATSRLLQGDRQAGYEVHLKKEGIDQTG